jgi:hypothetical protein
VCVSSKSAEQFHGEKEDLDESFFLWNSQTSFHKIEENDKKCVKG